MALRPHDRTVTGIYHNAVTNWWAHKNVYTGPAGFNYLPVFLPFFGLFARLPLVLCEDFRQAPTSAQLPLKLLCEDFRQAATSAQFPLEKLWLLLRHPFTVTTSAPGH